MDTRGRRHNIKKVLTALIMCVAVFMGIMPSAYVKAADQEQRTVKVAFPTQGGMGEVGEGGDLIGYNYSYLQRVAEYAGWNIEYITFEGQSSDEQIMSAMEMVLSGEADLLGPMLYNEQMTQMFEYPQNNYGVVYTTLCAAEKSNITSVNLDQYKPLRVAVYKEAVSRNKEVTEYLEQFGIDYELIECETTEEQVSRVQSGEADVLSSITLSYFDGTRAVAQFAPRPYYFVTTKGKTDLIEELDAAVNKLNYTQPYVQDQLQEEFFGDTSGGFVLTDDEKVYIDQTDSLKVLCKTNYAPYCSRDGEGNVSGVLVSLLDDFAKTNGMKVDYTYCDRMSDLEKEWETGEYDCMIGLPFSSEYCAENGMIQTSPVIAVSIVLFGKQNMQKEPSESTVAVYDQLAGQVDLSDYKEVIEYKTIEECYDAVERGKADYGCANRLGVDYQIIERNSTFVCTPLMGEHLDICVAVSRQHDTRFLSALNKYIHTLENSKTTSYLSEATKHKEKQGIKSFIQAQPILATTLFTIIGLLLLSSVMFASNARRNKKRNIQLVEASSAKSEFLSRMSHDIRTPMNAILGFAELGKQDVDSPDKVSDDLEKISSSGKFLLGLVNDVLDMTKIESHAMELKPQAYTRKEFIQEMETLIKPLCLEKHIQFDVELSPGTPECLFVDQLRFNQIFFNLLSNAVKYTPEEGRITITIKQLKETDGIADMEFVVLDNGIGMSEEFQKHMFDTFAQEQEHISGKEGTGLGLTIVKSLVEMMKGTIEVESKKGKGSKFIVTLPVQICEVPTKKEKKDKGIKVDSLKDKNVLLCEDHPLNTKLAVTLLEKAGIHVTCASNGKEGIALFGESDPGHFDAILMDIRMPEMDGLEATRHIRSSDRADAKTVPIIAMTANAFEDDVQTCKNAGMNEHISKPFDVNHLYEVLVRYLTKK